ncbi:MAG: SRPBCC family protein [Planctomycetes bacterium]|nr:SRPBCC family protein [Planctomycetota bacterium]
MLESRQRLARPRDEVFPFFADPANLEGLTPSWMHFSIVTPGPITMQPGAQIDYKLRVRGLPIRWRTLISAWDPPHHFEDTQLRGPYRQWIHQHRFLDEGDTTVVEDIVRYRVPGGRLVHRLLVRGDVLRIFAYRRQELERRFAP